MNNRLAVLAYTYIDSYSFNGWKREFNFTVRIF